MEGLSLVTVPFAQIKEGYFFMRDSMYLNAINSVLGSGNFVSFEESADAESAVDTVGAADAAETADAANSAEQETTTEATYVIPTDKEYVLDSKINGGVIGSAIVSCVMMLAAIVGIIFYVRKKRKGAGFSILGGIMIYLLFFYMAVNSVTNMVFSYPLRGLADNKMAIVFIAALLGSAIPVGGRILSLYVFKQRYNSVGDRLYFGLGMMITEGVISIMNMFLLVVSCYTINSTGAATLLDVPQSTGETLMTTIETMLSYTPVYIISTLIISVSYMCFHVALTLPLLGAYTKRISGWWFAFCFGSYFVLELLRYLTSNKFMPILASAIITALIAAVTVYIAIRMYNKVFKDDEDPIAKKKEAEEAAVKKSSHIPRFDNLKDL